MAALEKGITADGTGYAGKTWNILGQVYFPKAVTDSTFAFETNSEPGQFVPVHIHPTQDEFILVQEGVLDLKLDGVWVQAKAGDLVRLPRGIPQAGTGAVLGVADAEARSAVQPAAQFDRPRGGGSDFRAPRSGLPAARGQRIVLCGSCIAAILRDGALAPPQDEVLILRQNIRPSW
jgi:quercetin dioxygenase-like cupin family protein